MLLQATIIRHYFVKTQTSVASFGPPHLSIIFSNGMYLEVSPLQPITNLKNGKMTCLLVSLKFSSNCNTRHLCSPITIIVYTIFCKNNYCDWRTQMPSITI